MNYRSNTERWQGKDWKSLGDDLRREVSQRRSDAVPGLAVDKLGAEERRAAKGKFSSVLVAGVKRRGAMRRHERTKKCVE